MGTISGPDGARIPGVTLTLTHQGTGAVVRSASGEQGALRLPGLPPGVYTLRAEAPGFEAAVESGVVLAAGESRTVHVVLRLAGLRETLNVVGVVARDSLEATAIRESPARDVAEALGATPGVHKLRKGGIANDVVLRGFRGQDLSVLVVGQRLHGDCPNRMDPPAFHVDFAEVERIEVDKGPFDLSNAGSLGGTVNIVTRVPDAGPHAHLNLTAGSFGYAAPSLGGSWANERWSVHGGVAGRQGDPFEDGSGAPFTDDPDAKYRAGAGDEHAFDIHTFWAGTTVAVRPGHRLEFQATRQEGNRRYPRAFVAPLLWLEHRSQGNWRAVPGHQLLLLSGRGSMAGMIRTQLLTPDSTLVSAEAFNRLSTNHGSVMLFLWILPVLAGLGNYLVPLQIGARDMAFPRLNALSFWLLVPAGLLMLASYFVGAAEAGWTAYVPLSISGPDGQTLWAISVILLGTSSMMGAINFVTTIFTMRAEGLTFWRLPLFSWSMLATSICVISLAALWVRVSTTGGTPVPLSVLLSQLPTASRL